MHQHHHHHHHQQAKQAAIRFSTLPNSDYFRTQNPPKSRGYSMPRAKKWPGWQAHSEREPRCSSPVKCPVVSIDSIVCQRKTSFSSRFLSPCPFILERFEIRLRNDDDKSAVGRWFEKVQKPTKFVGTGNQSIINGLLIPNRVNVA